MEARLPLLVSEDDVRRISACNPGWRVERTPAGEVVITPPTGSASSRRNAELTRRLVEWAEHHGYVAFDSNGGFALPDSSIIAPDAALVPAAAWEALSANQRERFAPLVPVAAFELCSPTDQPETLREKLLSMRKLGTAFVALLDPYRKEIWSDGEPPPGFDVDLDRIIGLV